MIINLPFEILYILNKLNKAGFEAYVVGGAVRDLISNSLKQLQKDQANKKTVLISDYDFTTNAKPKEILNLFKESYYENDFGMVAITHQNLLEEIEQKHTLAARNLQTTLADLNKNKKKLIDLAAAGKIHVSLQIDKAEKANKEQVQKVHDFEITTYRSEDVYTDFRHPDQITWGKCVEEDLLRRDFTINAMALKVKQEFLTEIFEKKQESLQADYLIKANQYELVDQHHGMQDLSKRLIKTVGSAKQRFFEDALRMLRAIRFAVQLNFQLDEEAFAAIKEQHALIQKISWERIRDEFLKMLESHNPKQAISLMDQTGLLSYVLPELQNTKGINQSGHHTTDVWTHSLDAVQNCPNSDPIVRLAALLHDIGKPNTQNIESKTNITFYNHEIVGSRIASRIGRRLRLSKHQQQRLFIMVRYHMFYYQPHHTDASIRRFMRKVGLENVDDMLDLREGDRLGSGARKTSWRLEEMKQRMVEQLHQPMSVTDLAINGHDLMTELALKPGPKLGEILNQLLEIVLENPEENTRKRLLESAKKL